jgi:undecaprenyl-diphosphatase
MDIAAAILLGLIQGLTEWLPVSSSGHLVIAQTLLGLSVPAEFDIVIMAGTTLAILLYFRARLLQLGMGLLARDPSAWRYMGLMVLAGIPTAIVGFAGRAFFKGLFSQPLIVCALLAVTGLFLLLAGAPRTETRPLDARSALLIGLAQGVAVAPGISRSGSTIGTGLLMGIEPREAAIFSFFIGAPAMMVASTLEFVQGGAALMDPSLMLAGSLAALLAGYASIGVLMRMLQTGRLRWFGYYCLAAALVFGLLIGAGVRL